jgi:hypothetical protein
MGYARFCVSRFYVLRTFEWLSRFTLRCFYASGVFETQRIAPVQTAFSLSAFSSVSLLAF